jgi:hypothetical protein
MIYPFSSCEEWVFSSIHELLLKLRDRNAFSATSSNDVEKVMRFIRGLPHGYDKYEFKVTLALETKDLDFGISRRILEFSLVSPGSCRLEVLYYVNRLAKRDADWKKEIKHHYQFYIDRENFFDPDDYEKLAKELSQIPDLVNGKDALFTCISFFCDNSNGGMRLHIQPDCPFYLWCDGGPVDIEDAAENYSPELHEALIEWTVYYERNYTETSYEFWQDFHTKGIELGRKLKPYLKPGITIVYKKAIDDPYSSYSDRYCAV